MQATVFRFLIFDWLKLDLSQSKFAHLNQALIEQLLQLSEQLAQAAIAPIYRSIEQQAPSLSNFGVQTSSELKEALQALAQAGMFGTQATLAEGGTALPNVVRTAVAGMLSQHNAPVFDYVRQTQLAASLIRQFGSSEQQQHYLPLLAAGTHFGTLCLSERQAGTSLADVHCVAKPVAENLFQLKGHKAWVSGAEHDLSRNILYLVLARIEGAAPGTRGLSLFVVPRLRQKEGSTINNGVALARVNALSGMRAVVNADLNFGASNPCYAELLGGGEQGGSAMMQLQAILAERCLAAGVAAAGTAAHAFDIATRYTQQRRQGRALANADPQTEQIAIASHPAVRLKLLRARALADGAMLLLLYTAHRAEAVQGDGRSAAELSLLAALAKCSASNIAIEVTELAAQLCGAAGVDEALGLQALQRDAQAIRWLEGGDDQHALEMLIRHVIADQGATMVQLLTTIAGTAQRAAQCSKHQAMAAGALELGAELAKIALSLAEMLRAGDIDQALCQSSRFADALGSIVMAWLSLDVALTSVSGAFEQRYFENCRYLHEFELEAVRAQLAMLSHQDLRWIWQ